MSNNVLRLYVENWRCIERVEILLRPITVITGDSESGKTSLAYTAFFMAKVVDYRDVNDLLISLFGSGLDGVVRSHGNVKHYPVVIDIDGARFEAYSTDNFVRPDKSPWSKRYLIPSPRYKIFKYLAPFIIKDVYVDSHTGIKLPIMHAPSGYIDAVIIKHFVDTAHEDSLVVIEEPEMHKTAVKTIEVVRHIAETAVKKKLTVIMTTNSDITLHTLSKLIVEGIIKPEYVTVYYLERKPWTVAREIKVYEDGTMDELPITEKVIELLW